MEVNEGVGVYVLEEDDVGALALLVELVGLAVAAEQIAVGAVVDLQLVVVVFVLVVHLSEMVDLIQLQMKEDGLQQHFLLDPFVGVV